MPTKAQLQTQLENGQVLLSTRNRAIHDLRSSLVDARQISAERLDRNAKLRNQNETLHSQLVAVDERLRTRARRIAEILGERDRLKIELDVLHGGPVDQLATGDMILIRRREGVIPRWEVVEIKDIEELSDDPEEGVLGDLTLLDCRTQDDKIIRALVGEVDIALMIERKAAPVCES